MDEFQDVLALLRQAPFPQSCNTVGSSIASGQATINVGPRISINRKGTETDIAAKIRDTFFECDPEDDRDRLTSDNGPRTPDTCEWILEEQTFMQWRESSVHTKHEERCLWVSGRLGMGKTYMAIFVTEELEKTLQHGNEILLYFFCTHQSQERRHATGVLRGLIYTLLKKHGSPQIVSIIARQFDPMNKPKEAMTILGSVTALWRILTTLIDVLTKDRCIEIVIDALDECDDESFRILSANFKELCNVYTKVKVLLFTRDSAPLHDWRSVKLGQGHDEKIKSDVGKFSRQVAQQIITRHGLSSLNIDRLTDQLVEVADGSFLWIGFAAQSLSVPIIKTQDELYNRLNSFPKKLESVFNRILEKINSTHIEKSAAILRTVALASRPLSVLEVTAFVASEEPWEVTTRDALAAEQEIRNVIEGCAPLISISKEDGSVNITHFSVRQYLLRLENLSLPSHSPLKTFAFDMESEHAHMAIQGLRQCSHLVEERAPFTKDELHRLKIHMGETEFNDIKMRALQSPRTAFSDNARLFALFDYGISTWPHHLRRAGGCVAEVFATHVRSSTRTTLPPIDMLSDGENGQTVRSCWEREIRYGHDDAMVRYTEATSLSHTNYTLLSLAVRFKIDCVVDFVLGTIKHGYGGPGAGLGSRSGVYTQDDLVSAFCDSALYRSVSIAQRFLDHGIDVNVKGPILGETPLGCAILNDAHEMVAFLLSRSADVSEPVVDAPAYGSPMSALSMAACSGSVKSMELLLDHGLDMISIWKDTTDFPPLHMAAVSGQSEVIRLLLSRGIEVDLRCRRTIRTPLMCAALLLRENRDASNQPVNTSSNIIDILIENGASKNAQDDEGRTALHYAVSNGNMESARALLSHGADPDVSNFSGSNPLHLAIFTQPADISMMELLLDHQADVNARGAKGLHPLGAAIMTGQVEAARTLISRGAKVDSVFQWEGNRTLPLAAAIDQKSIAMVNLLLESGAQVTLRIANQRSSLGHAVFTAQVDILRSLLKKLPQGLSSSDLLRYALYKAIYSGNRALLVRELFEAGARVGQGMDDLNDLKALTAAVSLSDFETIGVLLEYGVDLNTRTGGESYFSVILSSFRDSYDSSCRLKAARCLNILLDHGVNDWEGGLRATVASGSVQAARAILEHQRCPPKLPVSLYLCSQLWMMRQIDLFCDRHPDVGAWIRSVWRMPRLVKAIFVLVIYFSVGRSDDTGLAPYGGMRMAD